MSFRNFALSTCAALLATTAATAQIDYQRLDSVRSKGTDMDMITLFKSTSDRLNESPSSFFQELPAEHYILDLNPRFKFQMDNAGRAVTRAEYSLAVRSDNSDNDTEISGDIFLLNAVYLDLNKNGLFDKKECIQQSAELLSYNASKSANTSQRFMRHQIVLDTVQNGRELNFCDYGTVKDRKIIETCMRFDDNAGNLGAVFQEARLTLLNEFRKDAKKAVAQENLEIPDALKNKGRASISILGAK